MRKKRAGTGLVGVLLVGSLAGLLIWSKLRLVSDIPRSAYAEREPGAEPPPAKPDEQDADRDDRAD